jgi:integrase
MTFRQCAEAYVEAHREGWKNAVHAHQWVQSLDSYVYPLLGKLPVSAIDTALIMKVLEPAWLEKTETMSRVRGRIESVLGWATVRGFRQGDNPARWKGHLDTLLPGKTKIKDVEHFAALPYRDIGAFMSQLRSHEGISAAALEFAILTAMRSKETLGARWEEFDLANRLWTIPAGRLEGRMKNSKEHIVPLSDAALAVLDRMAQIRRNDFVFPGRAGRLNKIALFAVLRRMNRGDLTAHGFRSSFRDWCGDCTNYPRDLAETCLAHKTGDPTEQAYRRTSAIEKRRQLMAAWAAFCSAPAPADEVVPIRA